VSKNIQGKAKIFANAELSVLSEQFKNIFNAALDGIYALFKEIFYEGFGYW
jgi:hypothetical protein